MSMNIGQKSVFFIMYWRGKYGKMLQKWYNICVLFTISNLKPENLLTFYVFLMYNYV